MDLDKLNSEEYTKLHNELCQRGKEELLATVAVNSETLTKLNISIEKLPQKCQRLLEQAASSQLSLGMNQLDPIVVSMMHSKETSEKLEDEYEIMKLRQKNEELQLRIDRNKKFLDGLRRELDCSRRSLATRDPNPGNIGDHIRQMQQKVTIYEESCMNAKNKLSKLNIPENIYPKSLQVLISNLTALRMEAMALQERADDVLFARDARDTIGRLRRTMHYN